MKTKMPTLSEATRVVCRRRYSNRKSVDNFLIAMKHNIKAIGNLPVNKITKPLVNKMMDTLQQERKNSNAVVNRKMGYLRVVLQEMEEDGYIDMIKMPKPRPTKKGKVHYLTEDMEEELLNYLVDKSFNEQCKIKDDSYLESNYILSLCVFFTATCTVHIKSIKKFLLHNFS